MRRSSPFLIAGLVLASFASAGCLDDLEDDCQTDDDCGPGAVCVLDGGVRFCLGGQAGAGGLGGGGGGTGGVGGLGGVAGGEAGGGGGGTGGVEVVPVDVGVEIWADAPLASFLAAHGRDVRELRVTVRLDGGEPIEQVLNDPPTDGYPLVSRETGPGYTFVLPLEIVAGSAPTAQIEIAAWAPKQKGTLARFATGSASVTLDSESPKAELDLTADGAFDFDGDTAADLADCAPENATIYPGAVDVCDDIDTDCNPAGTCVVPLPAGQSVRDISCANGTCIATTDGEGMSAGGLVKLTTDAPPVLYTETTLVSPLGIALHPSSQSAFIFDAAQSAISVLGWDGATKNGALSPASSISGLVAVSRFGTSGFAPFTSIAGIEFFDAEAVAASGNAIQCDGLLKPCQSVSFSSLTDGTSRLPASVSPVAIAIRQISAVANPQVYVAFAEDPRIVIAQIDRGTYMIPAGTSGLMQVLPSASPKLLAISEDQSRLYAFGSVEGVNQASVVATANRRSDHGTPLTIDLPEGVCVAAAHATASTLLVVDSCKPGVWTLPLVEGGVTDVQNAQSQSLPRCSAPSTLGIVAANQYVVGCRNESTMVVVGRD